MARLALVLVFCLLALASPPAWGQQPPTDPVDWAAECRDVYYRSAEGREDLARRLGELTFQKYSPELKKAGFAVTGAELTAETLGALDTVPALSGLGRSLNNLGQFMTLFALLSDTVAGQSGPRNAFLDRRFADFFKDSAFWAVEVFVKSPAVRGAFWLTQGADLLLQAFNAYLVQPFFDTYERMWWGAYEHYFLQGPGKRGLDDWLTLFGQSDRAAYTEAMDSFFSSPGVAGEQFVDYWSADGPWKTWFADADQVIQASTDDPDRLKRLIQINHNADRAAQVLGERFRARFFIRHLRERLETRSRVLLEQERQRLADQARQEDARIRAAIRDGARAGRLEVRVEDSSSGAGVPGASVKVEFGEEGAGQTSGTTNSAGTVGLVVPALTRGSAEVSAPDFRPARASFTVSPTSPSELRVTLEPVVVKVSVAVRVVAAASGNAVPGARVSARLGQDAVSAGTGSDGVAHLQLRQGRAWALSVSAPDYEGTQATVTPRAGETVRVVLNPKAQPLATGTLVVSAVDAVTGNPVSGATVTVQGTEFTLPPGGHRVSLPAGKEVELLIEAPGYRSRSARGQVAAGQQKAYAARLEPASGQLQVVIQDASTGRPVPGASVQVQGRTVAAPAGTATVTLPAGQEVALVVSAPGYAARGARGQVAAGQDKQYVCRLEPLQQNGSLTVTAVDAATGRAIPDAVVQVEGARVPTVGGIATLTLPAGKEVALRVSAPGYKPRQARGGVEAGQSKQYTARLEALEGAAPPAAAPGVDMSGTWTGSITYGGYTIPGFRLVVQGASVSGGVQHSQTDSQGRTRESGRFHFSGTCDPVTGELRGRLSGSTNWINLVDKDEDGQPYTGSSTYSGTWQGTLAGASRITGSYRMVDQEGDAGTGTFEISR